MSDAPSPEIRIDQLTGLRTILAPARADRPIDFAPQASEPTDRHACPFCEDNEGKTPPEVWADRPEGQADSPGWRARAVPNLYPALGQPGEGAEPAAAAVPPADPLRAATRGQHASSRSNRSSSHNWRYLKSIVDSRQSIVDSRQSIVDSR